MSNAGFELLYEEGPCLVVVKPGGVLTQAPPAIDSLEVRIKRFLKHRDQKSGRVYLGVPHRLDRPVSGVMVFCKHVRATRRLAHQFQQRTVHKRYLALVENCVSPEEGVWEDFVRKIPNEARGEVVAAHHSEARRAVLRYRVLNSGSTGSLLEIELQTGRMHQIRIQAAARNHAIWGDTFYGSTRSFGPSSGDPRDRWIALHAAELGFRHPMTQKPVLQRAPLPTPWQAIETRDTSLTKFLAEKEITDLVF